MRRALLLTLLIAGTTGCPGEAIERSSANGGNSGVSSSTSSVSGSSTSGGEAGGRATVWVENLAPTGAASAEFDRPGYGSEVGCMVQQLSDCTFYVCPAKGSAAFSAVSFGTITITGTAQAASLSPDPTGWKLFTFAGEPFQGGETLQFSDPGGADVPGFQHSIQAPFPVAITWPDLSASVTVVRSSGLPLSWTPAPFGKLNVTIVDGSHTQWLRCTFPAANGNATISPAALLLLDASNPNPYLGISTTNSALEDVGPWSVTFGASQPARLPNGMVAAPTIALQ